MVLRARDIPAAKQDAVGALLLSVGSALEVAVRWHHIPRPGLSLAVVVVIAATVAWRRHWPVAMTAVAVGAVWLLGLLASLSNQMLPVVALCADFYAVGARTDARRGQASAAALFTLLVLAITLQSTHTSLLQALSGGVLIGGMPVGVARIQRSRRAITHELGNKATRLERERDEPARVAVADERARVARELHDIVAHSVSVMVIQAAAARRVADADPDRAREALGAVQTSGRDALGEMRRMVGVLRNGDDDLAGVTAPGLAQLHALAERARAAGLPVELRFEGTPRSLSPGLDLVAYRIVQEGLTNTIKHAGQARVTVTVRFGQRDVQLEISDNGRGPGTSGPGASGGEVRSVGHGLAGMRERVCMYGGDLHTGRRRGGGFAIRARLPIVGAA